MENISYEVRVFASRWSDKDFFVLGTYRKLWRAKLAAWWYVNFRNTKAEVRIYLQPKIGT